MAGRSGSSGGRSGSSGGRSSSGGSSSFGRSSSGGWNSSGRSGSTGGRTSSTNSNNNNNNGMSDFEKLFVLNRATRPRKRTTINNYNTNIPNYNANVHSTSGITSIIVSIVMLILIALFVNAILGPDDNGSDITKSTVERTPITQGQELEYYHDDLDWIQSSSTLEEGMKYFFKKTGVQPILYIKGDINGNTHPDGATVDKWLQETYDATIPDESHMILLILDDGQGDWGSWVYVGSSAATVIDTEAQKIIFNYVSKWYNSDPAQYSEDELFSNAFKESADRIMKVTPNYSLIIIIVFGVLLAAIVLINRYIKAQQARKETLQASAEVLNAPLKRPGQQEEE